MQHSSFIKDLYFKSLTPFEKLELSRAYPSSFEIINESTDYLDYWRRTVSKENCSTTFNNYLTANNLNQTDVSLMMSRIVYSAEDLHLPVWIEILAAVLNQIDVLLMRSAEHPKEAFYPFFYPFIDYFNQQLQQNLSHSKDMLTGTLINQLDTALYKGLFSIAQSVLLFESNELKKESIKDELADDSDEEKFVWNTLSDSFQKLFLKYPILARRLATKTYRYLNFITSLLNRLDTDQADLASHFKIRPGLIYKLHLGAGDQHHGESTVIIEFENTNKVIYKPVNLSITSAYHQFLDWVNVNLEEELKTFRVIDKITYGWLEFVEHFPCQHIDEVKRYYEKAGVLLGVAYFLNATDFHFENVIASGASPVLIDHETILSPKLKTLDQVQKDHQSAVLGTVLETSLIPVKSLGLPHYQYGFGSSAPEMKALCKSNKPVFKMTIENLADYETEFKRGFHKLYHLILNNKVFLLSKKSPVTNFSNLTIRLVNRPSVVYYKILKQLDQPEYLADSIKYGIKLEILARAYRAAENWSPILKAEREQLLLNDIPAFYINTLDNHLTLYDREIFLIKFNAVENIYHKINDSNLTDYNDQMALITESIKI